jgi:hypothetical protein
LLALGQADELAERVWSKGNKQVIRTMKVLFDKLYADLDVEPVPAEPENLIPEKAISESVEPPADVETRNGEMNEDTEMQL